MIIKFEDYIKEDTMFTDNIKLNTQIFPIIRFDVFYGIINNLDLRKVSKEVENDHNIYWRKLYSPDVENDIMLHKCEEFFKTEVVQYLRNLRIGIKNIIAVHFDDNGGVYILDFDLRVNNDFIKNIFEKLTSKDNDRYNETKMDIDLFSVQLPVFSKESLMMNFEKYLYSKKTNNKMSLNDISKAIAAFLKYEIIYDNMNFVEKFNQYILADETLKDPNTYVKKEFK